VQKYQEKAREVFEEVCIDKDLMQKAGFERNIPAFVGEWLIDMNCPGGNLDAEGRRKVKEFIDNHLPAKRHKNTLRNKLLNGEIVVILDDYSVHVDLETSRRKLRIPSLDIENAFVEEQIVNQYPLLLCGGMWGAGKLVYHPSDEEKPSVWMTEFKPMQVGRVDIDYFCESRSHFDLDEWRSLLISSMGYNPSEYTPSQQIWLLTRLIPVVQNRVNLIELAPKGTGKSWIYINLSNYVRMVSGGKVTPAVLFYNNATNTPGLLVKYDVVVLDECQSISFSEPGEVIGVLKGFLEAGYFTRGKQRVATEASLVMLANVPMGTSKRPQNENLFMNLPAFIRETAFIDRIHGLLPGWELPKFDSRMIASGIGFKADFFAEVLHALRERGGYLEFIRSKCEVKSDNIRDKNAVWRLSSGFLKLLFPDLHVTKDELYEFCIKPALGLRQNIRNQLSLLDAEYKDIVISVDMHD
jgi:ATP-dependent Lon protease